MSECVIGLEIHVELKTRTKLFCGCLNQSGEEPNRLCCPVCAGLPGAMPSLNRQAVALAVRAGLVLGCEIHPISRFDRKHYFYPDLPKGYQITQYFSPLCTGGSLCYQSGGKEKRLGITRIHLEEDAGKLFHLQGRTLADLNRCGVPLIEIVTEPDLRSPQEAADAFRELHRLLCFAGVTAGRLNEGNMRCDVNLSLHEAGTPFGTRCEIKNLNGFSIVKKACMAEMGRQQALLEAGRKVDCVTLRFTGEETLPMRPKETPAEYRFMPEPDLPPLSLSARQLGEIRRELPPTPAQRMKNWQENWGISGDMASLLCQSPETAALGDELLKGLDRQTGAAAAMLLCTQILPALNPEEEAFPLQFPLERLRETAALLAAGQINATTAKALAGALRDTPIGWDSPMEAYCRDRGLLLLQDRAALAELARQAVEENKALADQYRSGKTKVLPALIGAAMKLCKGRAQPQMLEEALRRELEE